MCECVCSDGLGLEVVGRTRGGERREIERGGGGKKEGGRIGHGWGLLLLLVPFRHTGRGNLRDGCGDEMMDRVT